MLKEREKRRFARQIMLPDIGEKGQEKIKSGKVLVVGAGGLGCPVLQYLVAAGTGTVGIVEFDQVTETNLHRQILYGHRDIGKLKSVVAKKILAGVSDLTAIEIFNIRITTSNVVTLTDKWDIIIDATDNYETRYVLDEACRAAGKPLIHGAIYAYEGQVSVFNYNGGPSYRSYNPTDEAKTLNPAPSETGLFGMLPGVTGTLMAFEAIKIMTGTGDVLSGKILTFNIKTNNYYLTCLTTA
ncbi:MAG: HesA/MoeB/ThiF family protein [Bacteroidales bacterium]|jgi:adenylyltransferase/sulfurtransferase|nr:HesA/MoeB/ThiF family protein [Bacteroidales bacterium]